MKNPVINKVKNNRTKNLIFSKHHGSNRNIIQLSEKIKNKKEINIGMNNNYSQHFVFYDKHGILTDKIGKNIKYYSLVEKYFKNMQGNQPNYVLDLDSQDNILGCLLSFICKNTSVNILISNVNHERKQKLNLILKKNEIFNIKFVETIIEKKDKQEYYDLVLAEHKWDENNIAVYNKIARIWNRVGRDGKIMIVSHKNQGAERLLDFFLGKGMKPEVVGKGRGGVRLIELHKERNVEQIELIETIKPIEFNYADKEYKVYVDNAIFSKEKLDLGTEFLLKVFFESKIDLNGKKIGDLGSGWGAISIILANEFPAITILAIEDDSTSFSVLKTNLCKCPQVEALHADLTDSESPRIVSYHESLDYIITNPPFHINDKQRNSFFINAKKLLRNNGEIFFVVENSFSKRCKNIVGKLFLLKEINKCGKYFVFRYKNVRAISSNW